MDRSELGEGGSLRLANNAFPANWNPFHTDGNESNTANILRTVIPAAADGIVVSSASGEVTVDTRYASRLELVSEDPMVIEVELNEGMTWSDGTPINWTSVENVFRVMSGQEEGYAVASSEGYSLYESVEQGTATWSPV